MLIPAGEETKGGGSNCVPAGKYLVEIANVVPKQGGKGEYWNLHLKIVDGANTGKYIFDKFFFTEKTLNRTKHVLHRFDIDTTQGLDLVPDSLIGKKAYVNVEVTDAVSYTTHEDTIINVIRQFGAYEKYDTDDVPF